MESGFRRNTNYSQMLFVIRKQLPNPDKLHLKPIFSNNPEGWAWDEDEEEPEDCETDD